MCGGPVKLYDEGDVHRYRWSYQCTAQYCGMATPLCTTEEWAYKYWQRRDWKPPRLIELENLILRIRRDAPTTVVDDVLAEAERITKSRVK